MKSTVLLSTAYLPPISFFSKLYAYDEVCLEAHESYHKQSYRNRCFIADANGPLPLTVPVDRLGKSKCLTGEVMVSEHGNWRHVHRNAFVSAYKNSPFFDYYVDEFFDLLNSSEPHLFRFNLDLITWICRQIDLDVHISATNEYVPADALPAHVDDFRELIHPKIKIETFDKHFFAKPYYQVFREKHGFLPNLSIVDLLFNMGPESLLVLRDTLV